MGRAAPCDGKGGGGISGMLAKHDTFVLPGNLKEHGLCSTLHWYRGAPVGVHLVIVILNVRHMHLLYLGSLKALN